MKPETQKQMDSIKDHLKEAWCVDTVEDVGSCSIIGKDVGLKGGLFHLKDEKRDFYIALSVKAITVEPSVIITEGQ